MSRVVSTILLLVVVIQRSCARNPSLNDQIGQYSTPTGLEKDRLRVISREYPISDLTAAPRAPRRASGDKSCEFE